ncbi:MAG: sulfotransferase domain-containing protein [Steroidobacteraceae bacterium]
MQAVPNLIWVASYPRSGNTFLRTVLWHCFGLRSASLYPQDLGGNRALEEYVGHIEHGPQLPYQLHANGISLIKTHERPMDACPAIYVIRDGRAACVSLWRFGQKGISLEAVIEGRHRFGTWADHVRAWKPRQRPNTLLLRYEELRDDLPRSLANISRFLSKPVIGERVPARNEIAARDGIWVRAASSWQAELEGRDLARFNEISRDVLEAYGYLG